MIQNEWRLSYTKLKKPKTGSQSTKTGYLYDHFAPIREALPHPLIESARRQRMWEMTSAMLGSKHLGALLARFLEVKAVFYGHLHYAQPLITVGNIEYRNQAVWRKTQK